MVKGTADKVATGQAAKTASDMSKDAGGDIAATTADAGRRSDGD